MPNRIKELRLARHMTLEAVAERAGCSIQQIQRLENGTRRLTDDWMRRVAWAFGVQPAALLADAPVDNRELVEQPEEIALLRWWRIMDNRERRMVAALALDKGIKIFATNQTKLRRRRR